MDRSRLSLGLDLARRAGALLVDGIGRAREVRHKGAIDLVTEFDLDSERLIIDGIHESFPSDSILSEEAGGSSEAEIRWVIDPLDATTNFAHGLLHFSVSIACWEGDQPSFGIIFDPTRSELFHAVRGEGAWMNGRLLPVAPCLGDPPAGLGRPRPGVCRCRSLRRLLGVINVSLGLGGGDPLSARGRWPGDDAGRERVVPTGHALTSGVQRPGPRRDAAGARRDACRLTTPSSWRTSDEQALGAFEAPGACRGGFGASQN